MSALALTLGAGTVTVSAADMTVPNYSPAGRFYGGLFAGANRFDGPVFQGARLNARSEGGLNEAGVLLGWRANRDSFFFGGEADFGLALDDAVNPNGAGCDTLIFGAWCEYNGSAHLRLIGGTNFGRFDVFVSAGLAAAWMGYREGLGGTFESETLIGHTVGAGVEYWANQKLRFRAEVLHDSFNDATLSDGYNGKWSQNTVRAVAIFTFH